MSYMERNQKKEKPSKYNFHDYGHISSAPAVHIYLVTGRLYSDLKNRRGICQIFYSSGIPKIVNVTQEKRVNRDILAYI